MSKKFDFIDWARKNGYGKTEVPMDLLDMIFDFQNYVESEVEGLQTQNIHECLPNREFKGTLITYSGFSQSNKNILQIEVEGLENYIGNTLKSGDKVNIQHFLTK